MTKRNDDGDLRAEIAALRRRVANLERSRAGHSEVNFALKDLVFRLDERLTVTREAVRVALRLHLVSELTAQQIINGERVTEFPPDLAVLTGGARPAAHTKRRRVKLHALKPRKPRG